MLNDRAVTEISEVLTRSKYRYEGVFNQIVLLEGNSGSGRLTALKVIAKQQGFDIVTETEVERQVTDKELQDRLGREFNCRRFGVRQEDLYQGDEEPDLHLKRKTLTANELLGKVAFEAKTAVCPGNGVAFVIRVLPDYPKVCGESSIREWLTEYYSQNLQIWPIFIFLNPTLFNCNYFRRSLESLIIGKKDFVCSLKIVECHTSYKKVTKALQRIVNANYRHPSHNALLESFKDIAREHETNIHLAIETLQLRATVKRNRFAASSSQIHKSESNKLAAGDLFFHKIGKVLYNKRLPLDTETQPLKKSQTKTDNSVRYQGDLFDKNKHRFYFRVEDLINSLPLGSSLLHFRKWIFENYLFFCGNIKEVAKISEGFSKLEEHFRNLARTSRFTAQGDQDESQLTQQYCLNFMNKARTPGLAKPIFAAFESPNVRADWTRESKLSSKEIDFRLFPDLTQYLQRTRDADQLMNAGGHPAAEKVIIEDDIENSSDDLEKYGFKSKQADALLVEPRKSNFLEEIRKIPSKIKFEYPASIKDFSIDCKPSDSVNFSQVISASRIKPLQEYVTFTQEDIEREIKDCFGEQCSFRGEVENKRLSRHLEELDCLSLEELINKNC